MPPSRNRGRTSLPPIKSICRSPSPPPTIAGKREGRSFIASAACPRNTSTKKRTSYTTHAHQGGNGRNGLGSVFHWAEIAGVKTDKQLADTFRQYLRENKNPSNLQAPLTPTHAHTYAREDLPPAFPDYPWPPFIKQMIDCGNSIAQRDILLLGVFTVLGGTLNKRVRVLYGQKYMYPCLQTFIVAPPASGKGALTWVRRLAEPIHEELMARYKDSLKNYREEKNRWDSLGKKRSETPEPATTAPQDVPHSRR